VKILRVKDNSAASELALEAGDVVVAINGKLVKTGPRELENAHF
jgi:S1-C subfamily serine protease